MIFGNKIYLLMLSFVSLTVSRNFSSELIYVPNESNNGKVVLKLSRYVTKNFDLQTNLSRLSNYKSLDSLWKKNIDAGSNTDSTNNSSSWFEKNAVEKPPPSVFEKIMVQKYINDLSTENKKRNVKQNKNKEGHNVLKKERNWEHLSENTSTLSNIFSNFIVIPLKLMSRKLLNRFPVIKERDIINSGNNKVNPDILKSDTTLEIWGGDCNLETIGICTEPTKCPVTSLLQENNKKCSELVSDQFLVCCEVSAILKEGVPTYTDAEAQGYLQYADDGPLNINEDYNIARRVKSVRNKTTHNDKNFREYIIPKYKKNSNALRSKSKEKHKIKARKWKLMSRERSNNFFVLKRRKLDTSKRKRKENRNTKKSESWEESCNIETIASCVKPSKCAKIARIPDNNKKCNKLDSEHDLVCCVNSKGLKINEEGFFNNVNKGKAHKIYSTSYNKTSKKMKLFKEKPIRSTLHAPRNISIEARQWHTPYPTSRWTTPGTTTRPGSNWNAYDYWVAWKYEEGNTKKPLKPKPTTQATMDSWEVWKWHQVQKQTKKPNYSSNKKYKRWYQFFSSSWEKFEDKRKRRKEKGWTAGSWEVYLRRQWRRLRVYIVEFKKIHKSFEYDSLGSWERWKNKWDEERRKKYNTKFEGGVDWYHWVGVPAGSSIKGKRRAQANQKTNLLKKSSINNTNFNKYRKRNKKAGKNKLSNLLVEQKYEDPVFKFNNDTLKKMLETLGKVKPLIQKHSMKHKDTQKKKSGGQYDTYGIEYGFLYY